VDALVDVGVVGPELRGEVLDGVPCRVEGARALEVVDALQRDLEGQVQVYDRGWRGRFELRQEVRRDREVVSGKSAKSERWVGRHLRNALLSFSKPEYVIRYWHDRTFRCTRGCSLSMMPKALGYSPHCTAWPIRNEVRRTQLHTP
jgi:hypothetical protein